MKKAIITGTSGLVVARRLGKQNYQLTLVARNEEKLKRVLPELDGTYQILVPSLSDHDGLAKNKLMLFGFRFFNRAAA